MSNAKKIMSNVAIKERFNFRKKKVNINLDDYEDAIVDGKFLVKEKGNLYFERNILGKTEIHEGYVFTIKGDLITIFDETKEQFYAISVIANKNKVKAKSKEDFVLVENNLNS
jgi:hypothetical protein